MINAEEARVLTKQATERLNKEAERKADEVMKAIHTKIIEQCNAGRSTTFYDTADLEIASQIYKRLRQLGFMCSETRAHLDTQHLIISW